MSAVIRPTIKEENFNKLFNIVGLPKKVGFEYALTKLIQNLQEDGNFRNSKPTARLKDDEK
jgi:hypothetical protein